MTDHARDNGTANAWVVVDPDRAGAEFPYPQFAVGVDGECKLYAAVAEDDWLTWLPLRGYDMYGTRVARSVGLTVDESALEAGDFDKAVAELISAHDLNAGANCAHSGEGVAHGVHRPI